MWIWWVNRLNNIWEAPALPPPRPRPHKLLTFTGESSLHSLIHIQKCPLVLQKWPAPLVIARRLVLHAPCSSAWARTRPPMRSSPRAPLFFEFHVLSGPGWVFAQHCGASWPDNKPQGRKVVSASCQALAVWGFFFFAYLSTKFISSQFFQKFGSVVPNPWNTEFVRTSMQLDLWNRIWIVTRSLPSLQNLWSFFRSLH